MHASAVGTQCSWLSSVFNPLSCLAPQATRLAGILDMIKSITITLSSFPCTCRYYVRQPKVGNTAPEDRNTLFVLFLFLIPPAGVRQAWMQVLLTIELVAVTVIYRVGVFVEGQAGPFCRLLCTVYYLPDLFLSIFLFVESCCLLYVLLPLCHVSPRQS